jgi:hypothetical protein
MAEKMATNPVQHMETLSDEKKFVLMVKDGRRRSCRDCRGLEELPPWELLVVGVTSVGEVC